ncbi:unnamed protein product [Amoebophrya sp. A25]|nr:unnamed protein product [Amoebophrya sp. A25]|eukprot:GSA25T00024826001.1
MARSGDLRSLETCATVFAAAFSAEGRKNLVARDNVAEFAKALRGSVGQCWDQRFESTEMLTEDFLSQASFLLRALVEIRKAISGAENDGKSFVKMKDKESLQEAQRPSSTTKSFDDLSLLCTSLRSFLLDRVSIRRFASTCPETGYVTYQKKTQQWLAALQTSCNILREPSRELLIQLAGVGKMRKKLLLASLEGLADLEDLAYAFDRSWKQDFSELSNVVKPNSTNTNGTRSTNTMNSTTSVAPSSSRSRTSSTTDKDKNWLNKLWRVYSKKLRGQATPPGRSTRTTAQVVQHSCTDEKWTTRDYVQALEVSGRGLHQPTASVWEDVFSHLSMEECDFWLLGRFVNALVALDEVERAEPLLHVLENVMRQRIKMLQSQPGSNRRCRKKMLLQACPQQKQKLPKTNAEDVRIHVQQGSSPLSCEEQLSKKAEQSASAWIEDDQSTPQGLAKSTTKPKGSSTKNAVPLREHPEFLWRSLQAIAYLHNIIGGIDQDRVEKRPVNGGSSTSTLQAGASLCLTNYRTSLENLFLSHLHAHALLSGIVPVTLTASQQRRAAFACSSFLLAQRSDVKVRGMRRGREALLNGLSLSVLRCLCRDGPSSILSVSPSINVLRSTSRHKACKTEIAGDVRKCLFQIWPSPQKRLQTEVRLNFTSCDFVLATI